MRKMARRESDTSVSLGAVIQHHRARTLALACLLGAVCAALVAAPPANAQSEVGCLLSGPEEYWSDMWLDPGAGRLYIADWTNSRILIRDTESLADLGQISLASYLPDRPQQLAGHQGTHTLYVVMDQGGANQDSTVLVVTTETSAVSAISGLGENLAIQVDEAGGRLFAFGRWSEAYAPQYTLSAIDVASSSLLGRVDLQTLMYGDDFAFIGMTRVNPATGEIAFVSSSWDRFVIVNGRTLESDVIDAPDAAGQWDYLDGGTWNTHENKLYIATNNWQGYFVYDRDTGASTVAHCGLYDNDASQLFYSAATNRVYTGAEVDAATTIIEGDDDTCQFHALGGSYPVVGFVEATRHAYYVSWWDVLVMDELSLASVADFPSCIPPPDVHRPLVDSRVAVDQSSGRVFALMWQGDDNHLPIYSGPEVDYACVLVIQDEACSVSISPSSASYGPVGGSGEVTVSAEASCSWTATSDASWITIASGGSGTGDGTVSYSVAPNGGSTDRTGTLTIAGSTFTVTQSAGTGCTADETTLCLNGGRFKVEVAWRNFQGGTGQARVAPCGSDDSGLLWFFNQDNWEMLVKVLDGCGVTNHYWVFAAATTNVEYTLTVTDTLTQVVKEWQNPLGTASPAITDTAAFATCP